MSSTKPNQNDRKSEQILSLTDQPSSDIILAPEEDPMLADKTPEKVLSSHEDDEEKEEESEKLDEAPEKGNVSEEGAAEAEALVVGNDDAEKKQPESDEGDPPASEEQQSAEIKDESNEIEQTASDEDEAQGTKKDILPADDVNAEKESILARTGSAVERAQKPGATAMPGLTPELTIGDPSEADFSESSIDDEKKKAHAESLALAKMKKQQLFGESERNLESSENTTNHESEEMRKSNDDFKPKPTGDLERGVTGSTFADDTNSSAIEGEIIATPISHEDLATENLIMAEVAPVKQFNEAEEHSLPSDSSSSFWTKRNFIILLTLILVVGAGTFVAVLLVVSNDRNGDGSSTTEESLQGAAGGEEGVVGTGPYPECPGIPEWAPFPPDGRCPIDPCGCDTSGPCMLAAMTREEAQEIECARKGGGNRGPGGGSNSGPPPSGTNSTGSSPPPSGPGSGPPPNGPPPNGDGPPPSGPGSGPSPDGPPPNGDRPPPSRRLLRGL